MKILQASVMSKGEWDKDRDPSEWKRTRQQVLVRDNYTCAYCRLVCRKFMQVNHMGAEDDHSLENLETVCGACHSVLHLGISAMRGVLVLYVIERGRNSDTFGMVSSKVGTTVSGMPVSSLSNDVLYLAVFECKPEVTNMAALVCVTRVLVARSTPWEEIESRIHEQFALPGGRVYDEVQSIGCANRMLRSIKPPEFRGYLQDGLAVMFHEDEEWNGYPEAVWKWQCLPGSRYAKISS